MRTKVVLWKLRAFMDEVRFRLPSEKEDSLERFSITPFLILH